MLNESLVIGFTALTGSFYGPLDFLFQPWSFRVGGDNIFSRDNWDSVMTTFRIALPLIAAGLLLLEARARRLGVKPSEVILKRVGMTFTVLAVLAYFDFFNPNVRYQDYYHRHEFYHYYLGSKYFKQVGYTRLYECTAIAEVELGFGTRMRKMEIRDLRVNLIKPVSETYVFSDPGQCKRHFSPETWEAFKKDVKWFESTARGDYWDNMKKDHGYNPPPVWTMEGKFFSSFGNAGDAFFKKLALLDVLLNVGSVAILGWAFGWRIMAIAAVFWGCNAPANFYWTGGAFLRMDWIFLFVAAVCLARKRKFSLAGAALTWSSLLRVFPVIAFFGWAVIIGVHLFRKRELHPDHKQLIGGCIVAAGLLIPASLVVAGPDSYKAFAAHISVHKDTPLTNHMGLETMLVHDWGGRMRFTRDDTLDDPFELWKQGRRDRFHAMKPVFFAIVLVVAAWTAWALRRTKLLWVGVPMSLALVVCLTNLTCYYYSMFMAAAVLVLITPSLAPAYLVVSGASQILLRTFYFIDDKYTAQSYLFFALSLIFLGIYSRPFSVARLKAWIRGEPEPKNARQTPPAPTKSAEPAAV